MENYKIGLNKIKAVMFDIDGVFTDGNAYLLEREVVKVLNSRDRLAVRFANEAGLKVFVISGGYSIPVKKDLDKFGATEVHINVKDKFAVYQTILDDHGLEDEEVMYMGDDLPDLPILRIVGVSACPSDAASDVKNMVNYVSKYGGGKFAVRDIVEQVLRVQGKWEALCN